jgi:hypothetical protein
MKVTTQNLSGAKVPAQVKINMYPLKTPGKIYRSRYWKGLINMLFRSRL